MRWLLGIPMRRPRAVLAAIALLAAVALYEQRLIRIDSRTEQILPSTTPSVAAYDEFRRQFGTDEFLLVGLAAPPGERVVDPRGYAALAELTSRVAAVAEVESGQVLSLATVRVPTVIPALPVPRVEVLPLVREPPRDAAAADALARRIALLPLLAGFVVSDDLRTACVIATIRDPAASGQDPQGYQVRAVTALYDVAADVAARTGLEVHLAGTPVVKASFVMLLGRDMAVMVPLSALLICLVLYAQFRSWRGLVLPVAAVVLAVLGTTAVMAVTGYAINTITSLLPPLVLSVAVGESVHLISAWDHVRREPGIDPVRAVVVAVEETFLPCALTSFTTVAGFASLAAAPIRPIGEFGLFASLGTVLAFVLTFTLLPAVLVLAPARPVGAAADRDAGGGVTGRLLGALARTIVARPRLVLAVSAVPAVGAVLATVAWLEVEVDFVRYFKADHPISRAVDFFSGRVSGPAPLELVVRGPPGAFRDPAVLRRLDAYQARLLALTIPDRHGVSIDPVDRACSVVDFVKTASRLEGGPYEVPLDPRRLQAYAWLASLTGRDQGVDQLLSPDFAAARISARMQSIGSRESATLVTAAEAAFGEAFGADPAYSVTVTGTAVIFLEVAETVARGQLASFGSALLLVFGSMLLLFRSLRAALACVIPNLFPIFFTFGFMAVLGITLNMSTAMVASIAIGIAVDDTIHFLTAFRRHMEADGDPARAVVATFESVGPANFAMTVILCAGFGISVLASFYPTIHFGVLSAATIVMAFYGDFVMLPAILVLAWPRQGGPWCSLRGPAAPAGSGAVADAAGSAAAGAAGPAVALGEAQGASEPDRGRN